MHSFLAGIGAGVTEAVLVVTAQETLKTKLIHDRLKETPKYKGLVDGVTQIYAAEGFKGVYRGLVPTILRQGSNQGVRFLVYEECKRYGAVPTQLTYVPLILSFTCVYRDFSTPASLML